MSAQVLELPPKKEPSPLVSKKLSKEDRKAWNNLAKRLQEKERDGVLLTEKDFNDVTKMGMVPVIGRPSKYTPGLMLKASQYLNIWQRLGDAVPSIASLCVYLKITRKTAHLWKHDEDKADFCYILDTISLIQEKTLINNGLLNYFNSNVVRLMMGKHGYSDKQEVIAEGTDSQGREWTVRVINSDPIETTKAWIKECMGTQKEGQIEYAGVASSLKLLQEFEDSQSKKGGSQVDTTLKEV